MTSPATRRTDWQTPDWLFQALHAEFGFTVDAASFHHNAKLPRHWTIVEDGLSQDWNRERVFCNPPYGKGIGAWVEKAARSTSLAVLVVPVRTECHWWCDWAVRANEIRFARGRVHFKLDDGRGGNQRGSRPVFATAVLVFTGAGGGSARVTSFPTPRVAARMVAPLFGQEVA